MAAGRTVTLPQALALKQNEFLNTERRAAPGSLMQRCVTLVIGEVKVSTQIAEHLLEPEDG